jgi:hypothetical protein
MYSIFALVFADGWFKATAVDEVMKFSPSKMKVP